MCGINGIFGFKDKNKAQQLVDAMNLQLAHRGPDAQGTWSNDTVALGHRRLSIIDTSPAGNQPFFSDDGKIVLVFNGEIYNYIELKKELETDFTFKTESDTEVMIAAYRKWGIGCVEKFFGMFGFALWDEAQQSLLIVRDRLGIKPIYYAATDEGFIFSSEMRPIMHSGLVEKQISNESLADYLRYQTVHAPGTIIRDIKMIMPGQYLVMDANGKHFKTYWNLSEKVKWSASEDTPSEVKKNVHDLLLSSVELRMRADVPFGAFLSGGIDSSIIVGLMSKISAHPIKTFSVTFSEKEYDESPYSEVIAKKFNTDHTPIQLSANHFLKLVPDALQAMDHPSGDGPNTFVVSKVTREAGVKMALSGLGGDEVFAGYDVFKKMKDVESKNWINMIPLFARILAGRALSQIRPSISSEKIAEGLSNEHFDFAHLYPIVRQVLLDDEILDLVKSDELPPNVVASLTHKIAKTSLHTLSKVSVAEIGTYMQNVLLRDTDQMSMAHALEVRVPFLDHRLVEYVLGVSDQLKYPHTPKELLTSAMSDLLPREVIDRKKMGFTFPWSMWMKAELKAMCEENIAALKQIEALNHKAVIILWKKFLAGDRLITWSRIWPLVVLGHWVKQHDVH